MVLIGSGLQLLVVGDSGWVLGGGWSGQVCGGWWVHGVFGGNITEPKCALSYHGLKRKDVQLSLY